MLRETRGTRGSLVSLILPSGSSVSGALRSLDVEHALASDIPSTAIRQAATGAIASAKECLELYAKIPKNGLVIFTGTDISGEKISIEFEPDEAVTTSLYLCDSIFHVPNKLSKCTV
jgi:peptide chain release factor subunit 1